MSFASSLVRRTALRQWSSSSLRSVPRLASSSRFQHTLKDSYEYVEVEKHINDKGAGVGLIRLNRPKALNALCDDLFEDVVHAGKAFDEDDEIGCMILTGSTKAFAAGADISEMKDRTFDYAYKKNMFAHWSRFTQLSKPIIAAVNGFCLGGGCEVAMMCDFIVAGERARFGQPEINLGVIPGGGGTQRLVRAIGKSKAMHMVLTGDMMTASQMEQAGLVASIHPPDELVTVAIEMGQKIASKGRISVLMAKEAINASQEVSLEEGLRLERRFFHALFATEDQKEGMNAFLEKREPKFTNK